jgi:hypothetical protein
MENRMVLGKVDYNNTGKQNCEAAITWELKEGNIFSMCAEIWNPGKSDIYAGGQCVDMVAGYFPDNVKAQRMVEIWKRWHLNDLQAGCEHQRALKWEDARIPADELPKHCRANRDDKGYLAIWIYPLEAIGGKWINADECHKDGLLMKACPVCGYQYGSRWLKEEIPADIVAEIKSW